MRDHPASEVLRSLVMLASAGDANAYGEIVSRFRAMAVGYAYARLNDRHLAEDAAQEAFIAAWQSLSQLREPDRFAGWLRRIVHTRCERMRRRAAVPNIRLDALGDPPEPGVDDSARWQLLEQAVTQLPNAQRTVLTLFYYGEHSKPAVLTPSRHCSTRAPIRTQHRRGAAAGAPTPGTAHGGSVRSIRPCGGMTGEWFGGSSMAALRSPLRSRREWGTSPEFESYLMRIRSAFRSSAISAEDRLAKPPSVRMPRPSNCCSIVAWTPTCGLAATHPTQRRCGTPARMGNVRLATLLLDAGADPNSSVESSGTATWNAKDPELRALFYRRGGNGGRGRVAAGRKHRRSAGRR